MKEVRVYILYYTHVRLNVYDFSLDFAKNVNFKSDSHPSKKFFICFNETPLKMMKNAFYFILNAFRSQDI